MPHSTRPVGTTRPAPYAEGSSPIARRLGDDARSTAVRTLNAHSREALEEQAPPRIGFDAFKNLGARTAVLALVDQLLVVTRG
jgi:hypothetical protein